MEARLRLEPEGGWGPPADPWDVARAVAADLAAKYGGRLRGVIVFGSLARGDHTAESDIDLLVLLDRIDDEVAEGDRLSDITFENIMRLQRDIFAMAATEDELAHSRKPLFMNIRREGVRIA
jgi:predicted nucleotidyltransferase